MSLRLSLSMVSTPISSKNSSQNQSTDTKISTPLGRNLSRLLFWTVFIASVILSIQALLPSINYYREIAQAEFGDTFQADLWVWFTFIIRNLYRLIFLSVGTIIYLRKPNERISLLTSIFLLGFGSGGTLYAQYVPDLYAYSREHHLFLQHPLSFLGWLILFFYFIYFPDGRPVPPIARLQIIPVSILNIAFYSPQDSAFYPFNWNPLFLATLMFFSLGVPLLAQIYRYRRVSTPAQRQQTKWVMIGFALSAFNIIIAVLIFGGSENGSVGQLNLSTLGEGGFVLLPITLAIAMLRYRLWDIDVLINRSLAYAVVVGIGSILFFITLFGLQLILGQTQPVVAFVMALIVTGLVFQPIRRRVQKFVDQHIYHLRFGIDELQAHHKQLVIANPGNLSGKTLGKYQILDVIGKGGMGEVYKAQSSTDIRAIKTLLIDKREDSELIERFRREGEIGLRLHHPNIARVYEIAEDDGILYMVMDYLDGEDLRAWLKEKQSLDIDTMQEIVRNLADALDMAHADALVHRDIKPSNIMMQLNDDNETHRAILMDFGITKLKNANTLTGTGAIGTIDYMAPEQILEAKAVDARADIYALGILTYEMLLGERPFTGGAGQVMFAHIQQPAPDPRDKDDTVPRHIAKAILRALAKNPEDRFLSAGEFATALETE